MPLLNLNAAPGFATALQSTMSQRLLQEFRAPWLNDCYITSEHHVETIATALQSTLSQRLLQHFRAPCGNDCNNTSENRVATIATALQSTMWQRLCQTIFLCHTDSPTKSHGNIYSYKNLILPT